jgi:hypothetical protein
MNNEQLPPERELELKLKKHPTDLEAKVDVGSDYSMDASDPSSATSPGNCNDPVPSSGFPEPDTTKNYWSRLIKWLFNPGE